MVKSFFVGMGATVAVLWVVWGFANAMWHALIGRDGNWWGSWDWVSVAALIVGILWLIGKFFVAMGEAIRNEVER